MYKYKINVYPVETVDGTEWIARIPEVNNCGGSGETPEEAIKEAYENLEFELDCLKEEGKAIPKERLNEEYSGKISLRLPRYLHKKMAEIAEMEEVSLNQLIVATLSEKAGFYNSIETVGAYGFSKGCEKSLDCIIEATNKQFDILVKNAELNKTFESIQNKQEELLQNQYKTAVEIVGKNNIISSFYKAYSHK